MYMRHMHISMNIIITLSFFITDFLLSSSFEDIRFCWWHVNPFATVCQPFFVHSVHLLQKRNRHGCHFRTVSPWRPWQQDFHLLPDIIWCNSTQKGRK